MQTSEEIAKEIEKINQMTQMEMARLWRHARARHPYFDRSKPFHKVFDKRLPAYPALKGFNLIFAVFGKPFNADIMFLIKR